MVFAKSRSSENQYFPVTGSVGETYSLGQVVYLLVFHGMDTVGI